MVESVFMDMLRKGIITNVVIEETLPRKGKPALKKVGATAVWIVRIILNNAEVLTLESARGGPREWASLDSLNKWLRSCDVSKYTINLSSRPGELLQQNLAFVTNA
jgi:hypothetical protein